MACLKELFSSPGADLKTQTHGSQQYGIKVGTTFWGLRDNRALGEELCPTQLARQRRRQERLMTTLWSRPWYLVLRRRPGGGRNLCGKDQPFLSATISSLNLWGLQRSPRAYHDGSALLFLQGLVSICVADGDSPCSYPFRGQLT